MFKIYQYWRYLIHMSNHALKNSQARTLHRLLTVQDDKWLEKIATGAHKRKTDKKGFRMKVSSEVNIKVSRILSAEMDEKNILGRVEKGILGRRTKYSE